MDRGRKERGGRTHKLRNLTRPWPFLDVTEDLKISLTAVSLTDLKIIRENQKLPSHRSLRPREAGEWQSTREIGILLATCSLGSCCCFSITSECFELLVSIPRNKIVLLFRCACLTGGIITMLGYFLLGNSRGPHSFSVYLCPHEPRASREQPGSGQVVGWGGGDTDINQNSRQGSVCRLHFLCWGLSFLTICWMAHFWVLDLSRSFLFPEPNHSLWNLPDVQCIKMYKICVWYEQWVNPVQMPKLLWFIIYLVITN